ncbi:MAG: hypothetical protein KF858_04740 [Candidatus Sumerlaeia bacterium]|nr:hypothetical protein [Candidatus Sumerlaeia bacterium]
MAAFGEQLVRQVHEPARLVVRVHRTNPAEHDGVFGPAEARAFLLVGGLGSEDTGIDGGAELSDVVARHAMGDKVANQGDRHRGDRGRVRDDACLAAQRELRIVKSMRQFDGEDRVDLHDAWNAKATGKALTGVEVERVALVDGVGSKLGRVAGQHAARAPVGQHVAPIKPELARLRRGKRAGGEILVGPPVAGEVGRGERHLVPLAAELGDHLADVCRGSLASEDGDALVAADVENAHGPTRTPENQRASRARVRPGTSTWPATAVSG